MICIYHDQDLDGLACCAIMKRVFPEAHFFGWDYKYDPADLLGSLLYLHEQGEREVIFADVTLNKEWMEKVCEKFSTTIVDHHVTAYKQLKGLNIYEYAYDPYAAACEILWSHLEGSLAPQIIRLLGSYDVWRGEGTSFWEEEVLPIQLYLRMEWSEAVQIIMDILDGDKTPFERAWEVGQALVKFEKSSFEPAARQMVEVELQGEKFMALNATINPGRFMNYVRDTRGYEKIVVYYRDKYGWKYSLRSVKGVSINHVAVAYGGGGHPQAAGFANPDLLI